MCKQHRVIVYVLDKFFERKYILQELPDKSLLYVEQLTETLPLPNDVLSVDGSTMGCLDALNNKGLWFKPYDVENQFILYATVLDEDGEYVP